MRAHSIIANSKELVWDVLVSHEAFETQVGRNKKARQERTGGAGLTHQRDCFLNLM